MFYSRKCPVCGNTEKKFISWVETREKVERILCPICMCIYFDRAPPEKPSYDLKYNKHFFRPGDIKKAGIMAAKLAELAKANFKNPNVLEVGSGNGLTVLLLRAMQINTFGIDLDAKLSVYLMEKFNIPILSAKFQEFNPPTKYNLIYSSHTIEHQEKPLDFFLKAHDILDQKGIFFIDTPDILYSAEKGPSWRHFNTRNPYEHCCLFAKKTILVAAERTGFTLEKFESYPEYQSMQAILRKN